MIFLSLGVLVSLVYAASSPHTLHEQRVQVHGKRSSDFASVDRYQGEDFLNDKLWSYFTHADPTLGQVKYLSKADAQKKGLVYVQSDGKAVLRVDSWTDLPLNAPRNSVRISSKKAFNHGLVVADFASMPCGCAVWPAFWTNGLGTWPYNGEIDVVEGVNTRLTNQYTFHTGLNQTCNIPNKAPIVDGNPAFTANSLNKNCSSSPENDTGCGFSDTSKTSFGQGFNEAGGGIFAVLRDREGIKIWYFDRESTPNDVSSGHPEPSSWPSPSAFLSTDNCNVDSYFSPQSLILDITLCGTWAGADYPASGCPETCAQQVASAHNFINAKWIVNYIAMYNY